MTDENRMSPVAVDGYGASGGGGKIDIYDDYLPDLVGRKGRRTIRQMTNDETIGAVRFAIDTFFRGVEFYVDTAADEDLPQEQREYYREWLESTLFDDIGDPDDRYSMTNWEDFIINALTALDFGWSYFDVVPYLKPDGTYGIKDLTLIAQETLDGWQRDDNRAIKGLYQRPPTGISYGSNSLYIDKDRALHFVASPFKGSPEGKSPLRHIYNPWYYKRKYQAIEAILMERGCGFPTLYVSSSVKEQADAGDPRAKATVAWAEQFVANIKRNEQSGAVIYSDPYRTVSADGAIGWSSMRTCELKLETPGSTNAVDIDKTIRRSDEAITRGLLATFLMLGTGGNSGSLSLGQDQSALFLKAISGWLEMIASVVNRQLVPMLWDLNGFPPEYRPYVRPGKLTSKTVEQVSAFMRDMAASGIIVSDAETENWLREQVGAPLRDEEGPSLPPLPDEDE